MTKIILGQATMLLAVLVGACSGADDGGGDTKKKPGPAATATGTTEPPAEGTQEGEPPPECAPKGAKGNDLGVGAFCDKSASRCGSGLFCTADFAAPEGAQFCTLFCSADSDCGKGAVCYKEARGSACVPNACLSGK